MRQVEISGGLSPLSFFLLTPSPGEQRLWDGAGNVGQCHVGYRARFRKLGQVGLCAGVCGNDGQEG